MQRFLLSCITCFAAACGGAKTTAPAAGPAQPSADETSSATACTKNDDCFCRMFDGAKFKPGRAASTCCSEAAGCTGATGGKVETGHCMSCVYD